jgi:DNA-binding transcriptional LysR family regulator
MTARPDLNLIVVLDALLDEASVSRASERVGLTTPATSRALARLRAMLGDELLVRAGREMVRTPYAEQIRDRVRFTARESLAVLEPAQPARLEHLARELVVRCSDAVGAVLASALEQSARSEAPRVRLRFVHEGDEDAAALREGGVDLEVGVIAHVEPELRVSSLARDRFVAVARRGHPIASGSVSVEAYAAARHLAVSRRGRATGPIDDALAACGASRTVASVVPDFLTALHVVSRSDLVAAMPSRLVEALGSPLEVVAIDLPVATPEIPIGMSWHPRMDRYLAHRWLRDRVASAIQGSSRDRAFSARRAPR